MGQRQDKSIKEKNGKRRLSKAMASYKHKTNRRWGVHKKQPPKLPAEERKRLQFENIASAKIQKAQKGLSNGSRYPKFGYKWYKRGVRKIDYEKIAIVRHILLSFHSFGEICPVLHELNNIMCVPSPGGKPRWEYYMVYRIIKDEAYCGVHTYKSKKHGVVRVENAFPALITPEFYQENQALLAEMSKNTRPRGYYKNLLERKKKEEQQQQQDEENKQ